MASESENQFELERQFQEQKNNAGLIKAIAPSPIDAIFAPIHNIASEIREKMKKKDHIHWYAP